MTCLFCTHGCGDLYTLKWLSPLAPGGMAALQRVTSAGQHCRWWGRNEDCCFLCWVFCVSGGDSAGSLGTLSHDPHDAYGLGSLELTWQGAVLLNLGPHFLVGT